MIRSRAFGYVTAADFIVRSAYQMGKTPLLPLFAASLGAGDFLLGAIVSVSTLTGMVLKPFVGILSDRWGRRGWLIAGTAFFAFMPFVYGLIDSPGHLFAVRIIHGTATAIYGPVTLAYVAGLSPSGRAERLGWFSLARKSGYVVGPAAAGWMLVTMDPVSVFTVIGLLSAAAFIPVLLLPETGGQPRREGPSVLRHVLWAFRKSGSVPAVWLAGGLDAGIYVAVYAAKTFLPLYAVSMGVSIAAVGVVFAVQEAVHMVLNPLAGRLGDRVGHLYTAAAGVTVLGLALPLLTVADTGLALLAPAVLIGAGQALVLPSTVALASSRVREEHLAFGMGLIGSLRNTGKVAGPAMAGAVIALLDFTMTFRLLGLVVLAISVLIWAGAAYPRSSATKKLNEASPPLRPSRAIESR